MRYSGGVVGERIGFSFDPGSILTLLCGIQVKSKYGWRWFDLDEKRGFTDYSTIVPSGRWRLGFRASEESQGAGGGRVVKLGTTSGVMVIHTSFLVVQKPMSKFGEEFKFIERRIIQR
ncbi:hypothetical protein Hanom_Chr12g01172941 [Helianthus anomalus]